MLTKSKAALAAAIIIGSASLALAGDNSGEHSGGFVMPGSTHGVSPGLVPPQAEEAFGYAAAPKEHRRIETRRRPAKTNRARE
jgi:hypothetical protein